MKRYQILERTGKGEPWKFAAHGARYDDGDAQETVARIKNNGRQARLIAV